MLIGENEVKAGYRCFFNELGCPRKGLPPKEIDNKYIFSPAQCSQAVI